MWKCYIKPNRYVHSSGFRCFEVGYCTIDEYNKVDKKVVLSTYSDAINLHDLISGYADKLGLKITLDLTRDGYIRIFGYDNFCWHIPVYSNAMLEDAECRFITNFVKGKRSWSSLRTAVRRWANSVGHVVAVH